MVIQVVVMCAAPGGCGGRAGEETPRPIDTVSVSSPDDHRDGAALGDGVGSSHRKYPRPSGSAAINVSSSSPAVSQPPMIGYSIIASRACARDFVTAA